MNSKKRAEEIRMFQNLKSSVKVGVTDFKIYAKVFYETNSAIDFLIKHVEQHIPFRQLLNCQFEKPLFRGHEKLIKKFVLIQPI
ncbi:MAG: hypothetical protein ACI9P5_004368 [Saprospiraceae bacterium]|jgi:hypothetical protein